MSKAKSAKKPDAQHDNERVIAINRRARHEYEVLETLECGIMLVGSEVKSLRTGKLSLEEAYGRIRDGEVWLMGCDIPSTCKPTALITIPSVRASCLCIAARWRSLPTGRWRRG